jgi:hypothetical protein
MRKRTLAGLLVMVLLVAAAIGVLAISSNGDGSGTTAANSTATGRLTADPAPLTFADLSKQTDPAARTVLKFWFYGQWGSVANMVDLYNPAIRDAVGGGVLASALMDQRATFLSSRPNVLGIDKTPLGTVVRVASFTKGAAPQLNSFLLRRRNARWLNMYDSITDRLLETYGRAVAQPSQPGKAEPTTAATIRAGKLLAAVYRRAAIVPPGANNASSSNTASGSRTTTVP